MNINTEEKLYEEKSVKLNLEIERYWGWSKSQNVVSKNSTKDLKENKHPLFNARKIEFK